MALFSVGAFGGGIEDQNETSAEGQGLIGLIGDIKIKNHQPVKKDAGGYVLLNTNKEQRNSFANNFGGFSNVGNNFARQSNAPGTREDVLDELDGLDGADDKEGGEPCDEYSSPLVLDFGNNGVFSGKKTSFQFDIEAKGAPRNLSHSFNTDDYLLALDLNKNGKIDDGSELFGSSTSLPNGKKAANGFIALSQYDTNKDQRIDQKDEIFKRLRLLSLASGSMKSLAAMKVRQIDLAHANVAKVDVKTHNVVLQESGFRFENNKTRPIVDLWFYLEDAGLAFVGR